MFYVKCSLLFDVCGISMFFTKLSKKDIMFYAQNFIHNVDALLFFNNFFFQNLICHIIKY